jgi:hypothetical protein
VLARSVRNPLIIGVGTGVVLASGTASAALAAATPSPSAAASSKPPSAKPTTAKPTYSKPPASDTPDPNPTTTPPKTPVLKLSFANLPSASHPSAKSSLDVVLTPQGGSISGIELTMSGDRHASATCDITGQRTYTVKKLTGTRHVAITVAIPSNVKSGKVVVTAQATADQDGVADVTKTQSLTVTKPKSSSSGSSGSGSSGSSGSSSSSGSSGSSSSDLPVGGTTPTGGATTTPSNSAVLPPITTTPQQTPTTAPNPIVQTGASQSMRGTADDSDVLTFDKLASTQAAWLAALLVAFSLLLTQVRLGRAAVKAPKSKGAHRRIRRAGGPAH